MTKLTFAELIDVSNNSWHREGGQLYVKGRSMENSDFKVLVPDELLNAEHPDLAAAIHATFKWNKYNTPKWTGCIYSYDVCQTLNNLKDPMPTFLSTDGVHWRIKEINNFMVYDSTPPQVWLKGARQRVITVSEAGRPISFVMGTEYDGWYADVRALDADYPGWEKRYIVGRELGVRIGELFDYTFSETLSSVVELPSVTFD